MNPYEERLSRLLNAASRVPRPAQEPPYGLESRILAHVRSHTAPSGEAVLVFLRRALLCCCALMVASVVYSYRTLAVHTYPEDEIAQSAIEESMP